MINLILVLAALLLFIIYNSIVIKLFGIPRSLSNTYYLLNNKYAGAGIAFTLMLLIISIMIIYPWITIGALVSSWSSYLGFLPFLTCAGLMFVAVAPNFKLDLVMNIVHTACAGIAAACALLWICIVCWKIMYIIPIWILLCGGIAHLTKTAKSGKEWWLEMAAFGATFSSIIIEGVVTL